MKQRLNFAPQPFFFRDPRLLAIWLLNILALALMLWLGLTWSELRAKNATAHDALRQLQQQRQQLVDRHDRILTKLKTVDLRTYRKQMALFQGIQTSFAIQWGPLLDKVSDLLPEDVRLLEIKPAASRMTNASQNGIVLQLRGEARTKSAELQFMESLDAHPTFSQVIFQTENYEQAGVAVAFEIQFTYQPDGEG